MKNLQEEQRIAAEAAVQLVQSRMVVGLGTGSTAAHAIRALAARCQQGLRITGIPTSERSGELAIQLGIPLVPLERARQIDITIDGADEFDPALNLTKGGGGALLREKIVAFCSRQLVIVSDSNKQVQQLGVFPLPCEVLPFAASAVLDWMQQQYNIPIAIRQGKGEAAGTT
ncbi:MAG: ribose 5-phosphate isomerase A, partial [Candidatus Methylacidiphilales bacterium]